jgi:hypothetical protein
VERLTSADSCSYPETLGKALFVMLRAHSPLVEHFTPRRDTSPVSLKAARTQVDPLGPRSNRRRFVGGLASRQMFLF